MNEIPTNSKEINKKLDDLVEKVTRIDERLARQPLIEEQKDKNIDQRFEVHETKIKALETNQRWVVVAILGVVLNAIVQLIFK